MALPLGAAAAAAAARTAATKAAVRKVKEAAIKETAKGGWFQKFPREILFTPGGMVILLIAVIIEAIGLLIPIPIIGFLIQLPFVIIFYLLLITVAKVSLKSLIIAPLIELFFPFLPTWLLKIFGVF